MNTIFTYKDMFQTAQGPTLYFGPNLLRPNPDSAKEQAKCLQAVSDFLAI